MDRIFLHYPGTNDTFGSSDVPDLDGVQLFHFGYPPLMRRMYVDQGLELETLLRFVKSKSITTSLDMARPDPQTDAGRIDWVTILRRILPYVDVFLPSFDEILFMLDRNRFESLCQRSGKNDLISLVDGPLLGELANQLLEWGAGAVGIKLGDQGFYLRTSASSGRWRGMGSSFVGDFTLWRAREMLAPCFRVDVVGTTGAGDATVAGFLAALWREMPPAEAMTHAVAVGACNVEVADATSGIPSWEAVEQRMKSGWDRNPVEIPLPGWTWDADVGVWVGPNDGN